MKMIIKIVTFGEWIVYNYNVSLFIYMLHVILFIFYIYSFEYYKNIKYK